MIGKANTSMSQRERLTVNVSGIDSGFEITVHEVETIDGYTVVEYIESTGSQYIDTGFYPKYDTKVIMDIEGIGTGTQFYFGTRNDNSNISAYQYTILRTSTEVRSDYFGTNKSVSVSDVSSRMTITKDGNITTFLDYTIVNTSVSSGVCPYSLYLLDLNQQGAAGTLNASCKLYSCQIYDNGTLVRDYVPVKTDAGVYGLYDKVNNQFYGSASSTAFVGGGYVGQITVLGEVIGTSTSQTSTFYISADTNYIVSASEVTNYKTPESLVFKADYMVRKVEMKYLFAPTSGVYILDTNGKYWTTDDWDGSTTPDCVAVFSDSCKFGIALTEAPNTMAIHSSDTGALENYMTAISDVSAARVDYNGATNTANIMKLQSGTDYAAGWCNAYTFPSGKSGFLPSLGQILTAFSNTSAIASALTKVGGTLMTTEGVYYWTSTFWGVSDGIRRCWLLRWIDSHEGYTSLSNYDLVRPFRSL